MLRLTSTQTLYQMQYRYLIGISSECHGYVSIYRHEPPSYGSIYTTLRLIDRLRYYDRVYPTLIALPAECLHYERPLRYNDRR